MSARRAVIGRSASCLKTNGDSWAGRAGASFGTFDFRPEALLRAEIQARETLIARCGQRLHGAETPLELVVRRAQRRLGVHIELAREIGGREQEVADLLEDLRGR